MNEINLMTVREVAAKLKVSLATIDKLQSEGKFPRCDYTIACKRIYKSETIEKFLKTCEMGKVANKKSPQK